MPIGPDSLCLPAFFRGVIARGADQHDKQAPPAAGFLCNARGTRTKTEKLWRGITSAGNTAGNMENSA